MGPRRLLAQLWDRYALRAQPARLPRAGRPPRLEELESRLVPAGTWSTLANAVPASDGAENMMLLSDGSVMVHGGAGNASSAWYKLSPDSSGSYVNGSWSTLPSMGTQRLFFASNVLPSGKVFVLGGEYSGPDTTSNDINTGEVYDPFSNSWSSIASFPQSSFGDDPTQVLPDGRVLAGYLFGSQTYLYSPSNGNWTATAGSKLRGDASDEESWVKLPDGSILSYDVFSSISTGTAHAQRYLPSQDKWIDAGTITDSHGNPLLLSGADQGYELGPALLLPDGRAFFTGANGHTAFYTPPPTLTGTGTWSAGPDIPNGLTAADTPAAMLPNGHVLLAVAPEIYPNPDKTDTKHPHIFPGPTTVYEFDPTTNHYTDVTPSLSGFSLNHPSFVTSMLVLPTGQVAMTNDSGTIAVYTPDGAPSAAWRPAVTGIKYDFGSTFTLTGTQLNGLSEGSAYGDDEEMSSNYPLLRFTDAAGHVSYARTSNWSSTGVQTAGTLETVDFTLPPGVGSGTYFVSVIANGIASAPVVVSIGTAANDTVTLDTSTVLLFPFGSVTLNGSTFSYFAPGVAGVYVLTEGGNNTVFVHSTPSGVPTSLIGGGNDWVYVRNSSNSMQGIQGSVSISNPPLDSNIVLDDSGDPVSRTATLGTGFLSGLSPAPIFFTQADVANLFIYGGSGGNTFNILSTPTHSGSPPTTYLNSGTGADKVNVLGTAGALSIQGNGGADAVNIGSLGSLAFINGAVSVGNANSSTALTLDDSADTTARTASITSGAVTGLAPATISYQGADSSGHGVTSLAVRGGSGGNTFTVASTAAHTSTTLDSGSGADTVNVQGTAGSLSVQGDNGFDTVNIGSSGSLLGIAGGVSVGNANGSTKLNIDDSADATARTASITSSAVTGLSPATISYTGADASSHGVISLAVRGGSGGNTFTVASTAAHTSTTLDSGTGADTVNVKGTTGALSVQGDNGFDTVNIGSSGSLLGIAGGVSVGNANGSTALTLDGSDDTPARTVSVSGSAVTGLAPAAISYQAGDGSGHGLWSLNVKMGSGGNAVMVNDTPAHTSTTLHTGLSADTVKVLKTTGGLDIEGDAGFDAVTIGNAGSLAGINGSVSVGNTNNSTSLTIDDSADTTSHSATLGATSLTGLAPAGISWTQDTGAVHGVNSVSVRGGTAASTWNLTAPAPTISVSLSGSGKDTLTGPATGGAWSISGSNAGTVNGVGFSGMKNLTGGSGNDTFALIGTGSVSGLIAGGGGSDTLVGPNGNNAWKLTGSNAGSVNGTLFSAVRNLMGGSGNDTFTFGPGGSVAGLIDGGAGTDRLDYSGLSATVTVNLQTGAATFTGGVANLEGVVGSTASNNTLVGPNAASTWSITAANAGTVNAFSFSKFANLTGGTGVDVFKFGNGVGVSGAIKGGAGDWLDYSAYTTAINVNLATGSATGVGLGVSGVQNARAGSGGSTLVGNALGNILVGGAGADTIVGGSGRSLLIGGKGADKVSGGSGDDIIIGGSTGFDANNAALQSILAEWQSGGTYAVRLGHLKLGGGLNGTNKLVLGVTVLDDGLANVLAGGAGQDWFFKGAHDVLTDLVAGEQVS